MSQISDDYNELKQKSKTVTINLLEATNKFIQEYKEYIPSKYNDVDYIKQLMKEKLIKGYKGNE